MLRLSGVDCVHETWRARRFLRVTRHTAIVERLRPWRRGGWKGEDAGLPPGGGSVNDPDERKIQGGEPTRQRRRAGGHGTGQHAAVTIVARRAVLIRRRHDQVGRLNDNFTLVHRRPQNWGRDNRSRKSAQLSEKHE